MRRITVLVFLALLSACGGLPPAPPDAPIRAPSAAPKFVLDSSVPPGEIVLYAIGLLDTGYKFGGRNPDAGLDCSGMVAYIVEQVSGRKLPHNAAQIASITRNISRAELKPADLVFFNTTGATYSHMGVYLGDGRFVHAPSTNGRVRIERLDNRYFATRFTGARSLY